MVQNFTRARLLRCGHEARSDTLAIGYFQKNPTAKPSLTVDGSRPSSVGVEGNVMVKLKYAVGGALALLGFLGLGCDQSCSVTEDTTAGTATIACPDGTTTVVSTGTDSSCMTSTNMTTGERTIDCDGTVLTFPADTLVNIVNEPEGTNCIFGGQAIQSGGDLNTDTILQAGEVTDVTYVCAPGPAVLTGDVMIQTLADLQSISQTVSIEGTVFVVPFGNKSGNPNFIIPNLETVGGSVILEPDIGTPTGIVSISAPALTTVGSGSTTCGDGTGTGDIIINNVPDLETLDLAALECVEGSIDINTNPVLQTLNLTSLATVGRDLSIYANGSLATGGTFALPALQTVGRHLYLVNNDAAVAYDVSALTAVGTNDANGYVQVDGNLLLQTLNASALVDVPYALYVQSNPALTAVNLDSLATVASTAGGRLEFDDDDALTSISLPSLTRIGPSVGYATAYLYVWNHAELTSFSAPALVKVGRDLQLSSNPLLSNVNLTSLLVVGDDVWMADGSGNTSLCTTGTITVPNGSGGTVNVATNPAPGTIGVTSAAMDGALSGSIQFCFYSATY